jgi:hypothetical protein
MLHRLASPLLCLTFVAALACSSESAPPPAAEAGSASEVAEPAASTSVAGPKITCADAVHEFGAISPNTSVEHVFTIKNEGNADLKIERIQKT